MARFSWATANTSRHNLNRLWFAQSVSLLGMQVGSVAVPLLAVDLLRASASQVALIGTFASLPWLIAPAIGVVADWVSRKRLLVLAHFGRSVLWLTVPVTYLAGLLTLTQLWLVSAVVGVLSVVFGVGYRAFLPAIVPDGELGSANGKMGGTDAAARATGPAVAGYMIQLLGAVWIVPVQTLTSVLAGVSTAVIRVRPGPRPRLAARQPSTRLSGWWCGIVDGFRCIYRITPLRWLALGETAYLFFFDVCFAVVVVFFRTTLGLSAAAIGVIFSAGSVGGILGASAASRFRTRVGFDVTVRAAAVLRGLGLAILPLGVLVPGPGAVAVLIAGRGMNACAWSVYEVLTDTYQQTVLPDSHRGSATAASLWLGNGASTLGAAVAAALVTTAGTTGLLAAAGIGAAAAGLLTLRVNTGRPAGGSPEGGRGDAAGVGGVGNPAPAGPPAQKSRRVGSSAPRSAS